MNDEEKQPDNTPSPSTGESIEVLEEMVNEPWAVTEDNLNVEQASDEHPFSGTEGQMDQLTPDATELPQAEVAAVDVGPTEADYAAAIEALTQELEAVKAQLDERNQQCESVKGQYMRIAKDFENFRQRTQKEREELEIQVKRSTITELLPVVDNFERARSQLNPQTDSAMTIHKSYQSVYKQLADSLKRIGVSPMRPEGKEFDPNLHEAVIREPTNEHPEGTVVDQLQRGYFLGDRVLRHALVKVAAAMEPVIPSEGGIPDESES